MNTHFQYTCFTSLNNDSNSSSLCVIVSKRCVEAACHVYMVIETSSKYIICLSFWNKTKTQRVLHQAITVND